MQTDNMPHIDDIDPNKWVSFGILYDIGDFPSDRTLKDFPSLVLIADHIAMFDDYVEFKRFYEEVRVYADIDYGFSCEIPAKDAQKAFINFSNSKMIEYREKALQFLKEKVGAKIYEIDDYRY